MAPRDVAEHGLPSGTSLPRPVHRVSPVYNLPLVEGPDEHPWATAWNAVVHEHAIVRAQPVPPGVSERLFRAVLDPLAALPGLDPNPAERQGQSRDDQRQRKHQEGYDDYLLHVYGCLCGSSG